ncbi:4-hydroxybenzoate octaprenyltransferase [Reinekea marinisedimentorum]|uniref:4-hydroxybenzoate octaprenyltransferase n=1 Tax=Reinekea marinisedimentorum TaxID=230495 RepID=A0A4R3HS05_9GAMM|nr:4-hydroxybenzoate octaprenyltransferase [Reinekea marinisedimentorum]TCS35917.1 4-hydroxybenzoate polyprenyltransferase [Reinekea marinisedimentorum]
MDIILKREALPHYIKLMRLDRPIGIYLLLWPTVTALWLAAEGIPDLKTLFVFVAGVVFMRSAGCVINDFADRKIDGHVQRTVQRPLASGLVSEKEALLLFAILLLLSFLLVLQTNATTVRLSFVAVLLAASYPFMKRYTYLPQVVLGAAFAWAVPMAYTALEVPLQNTTWLLFSATVLWTVAYDTLYAMVDRDDDLKIGVRSTAILFGENDRLMIGLIQLLTLASWILLGVQAKLGVFWWLGIMGAAGLFCYQQWLIRNRDRDACFKAFLHNNWVGLLLFLVTVINFMINSDT